jgi:RNA polymerase sigma-70 factor (ECF subfamily)
VSEAGAVLAASAVWSDEEIVERVLGGERALFELLMRRHNQRIYRAARAILRDEAEVDDLLQDAWLAAYRHLAGFERRARFSTWLTRIAVNLALDRRRRRASTAAARRAALAPAAALVAAPAGDPEQERRAFELVQRLERAVDALPEPHRLVYLLREVQGLDTREAAECLRIPEATVKTRLHRARALLRAALGDDPDPAAGGAFPFGGARCDRLVAATLRRIG